MKLYQVLRQVVPDRVIFYNDATSMVTPGLAQVVWEGTSCWKVIDQLDMARGVKTPKGTVYVIHEYEFSA